MPIETSLIETPGQVITFYSYKGGTGRSMALANIACLLAQRQVGGKGVLMVDWDLEAPGLHRFFQGRFNKQFAKSDDIDRALDEQPGLMELFLELDKAMHSLDFSSENQTEEIASTVFNQIHLERFIVETDIPSLYLLKAGCFDEKYAYRVNTFQWEDFYNRSPSLIRLFAERLTEQYQYVLIDSRTGITDISGICTMLMPDKLVAVFTPNRQSLTGVLDVIRQATNYRRQSDDLRPLVVFPLPSRIEVTEPTLRDDWRYGNSEKGIDGYQPQFEALFKEVYDLAECKLDTYFDEVQIQHIPSYAYGEEIAVLVEQAKDRLSLTRSYESFTERLVNLAGPWEDLAPDEGLALDYDALFFYYSSHDQPQVEIIAKELKRRGLKLWLDTGPTPLRYVWRIFPQRTISKVKSAVIFIGPKGLESWQTRELETFTWACPAKGVLPIAVLLPGVTTLPPDLSFLQALWLPLKSVDDHEALEALERRITGKQPPKTESTRS